MKLTNPNPRKYQITARQNKDANKYRVQVKHMNPLEKKGRRVWSFTVYDTNLNEIKDVLVKAFEDYTGEEFPIDQKRDLQILE